MSVDGSRYYSLLLIFQFYFREKREGLLYGKVHLRLFFTTTNGEEMKDKTISNFFFHFKQFLIIFAFVYVNCSNESRC